MRVAITLRALYPGSTGASMQVCRTGAKALCDSKRSSTVDAELLVQVINDSGTQVVDNWAFNADELTVSRLTSALRLGRLDAIQEQT